MKTTTCPGCRTQHKGPRSFDDLHREGYHVLIRSLAMSPEVALEFLRSQWMAGALELSGLCPSCVFMRVTVAAPGMTQAVQEVEDVLASIRPTDEQIEEGKIGGDLIPFPRSLERVARSLLSIGSPKEGA